MGAENCCKGPQDSKSNLRRHCRILSASPCLPRSPLFGIMGDVLATLGVSSLLSRGVTFPLPSLLLPFLSVFFASRLHRLQTPLGTSRRHIPRSSTLADVYISSIRPFALLFATSGLVRHPINLPRAIRLGHHRLLEICRFGRSASPTNFLLPSTLDAHHVAADLWPVGLRGPCGARSGASGGRPRARRRQYPRGADNISRTNCAWPQGVSTVMGTFTTELHANSLAGHHIMGAHPTHDLYLGHPLPLWHGPRCMFAPSRLCLLMTNVSSLCSC